MAVSSKSPSSVLADTAAPFSTKFSDISDTPISLLGSSTSFFPFCGSSGSFAAAGVQQRGSRYENGKIHSLIEAMRDASPTRSRPQKEEHQSKQQATTMSLDSQYAEWLETHPSALDSFATLMQGAEQKRIAVFLDYDGTLAPIVENPDQAFMSDEARAAVKDVASHFPTAIISGRGRDKVKDFVGLSELYYAGSHGMDIMGPVNGYEGVTVQGTRGKDENGNDVVLFQPASEFLPMMNEVFSLLEERAKDIQGASVENNTFCITIHFRRVLEESWPLLAEAVHNVLKDYPELRLTQGRKVLEVRPCIEWDKGKAVEYLLHLLGLKDSNSLPIYIGDDKTDEDAFNVFKNMQVGCGILVTKVAKSTDASFSLRDPTEVEKFLRTLVSWSSKQQQDERVDEKDHQQQLPGEDHDGDQQQQQSKEAEPTSNL